MFVNKNISFRQLMTFSGWHLVLVALYTSVITVTHELTHWEWMHVPWLPLSVIGTAVAFYVGFKNNQAYDRLWEARKIWGGIVNSSRAWGSISKAYVTNQFAESDLDESVLDQIRQRLIYRHIGWLYALRSQLLIPTSWEHIRQGKWGKKRAEKFRKQFGVGLIDDEVTENELKCFLPATEFDRLINYKNTATQILDQQAQDLKLLRAQDAIDDFRHMEMQSVLNDFYIHQGKCERIKKFPLPRQYGSMSRIFVGIFVFLLPFPMVTEFHELGELGVFMTIPFTVIVAWVFIVMELVGDYSENPFEGLGNDIPMHALCRTIEIDLREMLGETDLPPAVVPKNNVLM